ncbi:tetratricopeptide repeat protein [bacterium BMS3Abin04]|nr:tetratricopeptide repeat protein [bacterium BMS3Abin04]
MKYIRLFSNSKNIYFEGKAHEQIQNSLIKSGYKIAQSYIEIIHYGYNLPKEKLKSKAERNLRLLLSDYDKIKNSYLAYQLANTYSVLDKHENALKFYSEALKDKTLPVEYRSMCFLQLADDKMQSGDLKEAHDLVKEGLALDKANVNLIMLGSQVFSSLNNYSTAIKFCKDAYKFNSSKFKNNSTVKNLDISIEPQKILYQGLLFSLKGSDSKSFYFFLNKLEKLAAERKLEKSLILGLINNESIDENDIVFLKNIIDNENLEFYLILLSSYNKQKNKLSILSSLENKFNNNSKYLVQVGLAYYEKNDLKKAQEYFELSLEQEEKDPPAVFYLASIYLNTNNIEKLISIIEFAEHTFSNNKIVQEKLQILVSKIKPLLEDV